VIVAIPGSRADQQLARICSIVAVSASSSVSLYVSANRRQSAA
jgi:hypothetical protein